MGKATQYWLVKSEPAVYPFSQLKKERRTEWTGIRNYQARNNLRAMRPGDVALYYHTGDEKAVVGLCEVASAPGPDSTAPGEDWTSVEVKPLLELNTPVSLAEMKAQPALKDFLLLRQSRLSVVPVTAAELRAILKLGKTKLP